MEKIFSNSEEKYVKKVVVYGKKNDEFAYVDADCKVKCKAEELLNACKKGALVFYENAFYAPVAFNEATNGVVTVSIYDVLATTPAKVSFKTEDVTDTSEQ